MSKNDKDSKTEKLRVAIQQRVDKEECAFRLVEKMVLLDSVDKEFLLNAGIHITLSQYKDVTEERAITKLCGYPLCSNRIIEVLRQKYKISLRDKKVYDITERKNFCSNKCYKASKYFESQLSSEPVWMKEETKSIELKLLDDGEELAKKFSGSGEEVLMSTGRSDEKHELVHGEHKHDDDEHEHDHHEYEHNYDEHEHVDDEHEHVDDEHEQDPYEHEDNHNEHDDHEYVHVHDKHSHVDGEHENDSIHKNNEDLSHMIGRIGNVLVDFDLTDSDDDNDDDIEDAVDDKMKIRAPNSKGKTVKDTKSNIDYFIPGTRSNNHTTKLPRVDSPKDFSHQRNYRSHTNSLPPPRVQSKSSSGEKCKTTDLPKKEFGTNDFRPTVKPSGCECESVETHIANTGETSVRRSDNSQSSEEERARKHYVSKVHEVLLDWCSLQTKEYIRQLHEEKEMWDQRREDNVTKEVHGIRIMDTNSLNLPSIDSKSQMVIRGKIVSEKLTIAIFPLLSKLNLSMADISSQLTSLLKTFRFTNKNIVLNPVEWTLTALVLLLVLVKCSPTLTGLLSSRQKDLHQLLSNTVDDEDVDRLLGAFNFDKSAMVIGQQQFDMEELD